MGSFFKICPESSLDSFPHLCIRSSLGRLPPGFKGFHSLPLQALWAAGRILLPYNCDQASPLGKCSHDPCPCQSRSQHPHCGPRDHPCLMTSLSSRASLSQQFRGGPLCSSHTECQPSEQQGCPPFCGSLPNDPLCSSTCLNHPA